jgi:mannose-1-phosphate guanylyltransferase
MQALILAGGEGTRLRPLTSTVPKPVVPLVDRPFIVFMLDWLRGHGVDDVIMSCGFLASGVRNVRGARATLALTPVEDPTAYGLVRTNAEGAVSAFVEKPSPNQIDTHNISAGIYVLERSVLELLEPDQPASIERDVFPRLVGEGLYGYVGDGYWLDIGTPERYLEGTFDILEGTVSTAVAERMGDTFVCIESGSEIDGRVIPSALIEHDCRVGEHARIGGRVVLEAGVAVGAHTTIERAVVLRGSTIGANCTLSGCVVAAGVEIGDNTHLEGLAVLGEGVTIGADNVVTNGARIFPGVTIPDGGILF